MGTYRGLYRLHHIAPLPVIEDVSLKRPPSTIIFTGRATVDTGADLSNIPIDLIRQNRLQAYDQVEVEMPDGVSKWCDVFDLEVSVAGLTPIFERFIDYGYDEVIFGRPLLNIWSILLDPSRRQLSVDLQMDD